MERKKFIIIFLGILAIVLAILLIWLFFFRGRPTTEGPSTNLNINQEIIRQTEQLPPPSQTRQEAEKQYPLGLQQLAYSFAERFGSYSTATRHKNLEDLNSLMTSKMQQEAVKLEARGTGNPEVYDGYSTKALSSDLVSFKKDKEAMILVKTQRAHYKSENGEPEISYQNLLLKLVKFGEEWKIDEAKWQ